MKVYLDDERPAPEGWVRCRWPEEVIELIEAGGVEMISLDYYLGEGSEVVKPRTGLDVLVWLEAMVTRCGMTPPRIQVHSAHDAKWDMRRIANRIWEVHRARSGAVRCAARREHGVCGTLIDPGDDTCGACGAERPR